MLHATAAAAALLPLLPPLPLLPLLPLLPPLCGRVHAQSFFQGQTNKNEIKKWPEEKKQETFFDDELQKSNKN